MEVCLKSSNKTCKKIKHLSLNFFQKLFINNKLFTKFRFQFSIM